MLWWLRGVLQVEAAARVANAHDFIAALPEAYGTKVCVGGGP